jgi:hypothetical protein
MLFIEDFFIITNLDYSNYVKLPSSVLQKITLDSDFSTFYFQLQSPLGINIYVGVKEFTTDEQIIEVPMWIAEYLCTDSVKIKLVNDIPKCEFLKIQPQNELFFTLPDIDYLLENALSQYCLLELNQIIYLSILDEPYEFKIISIKSTNVECDLVEITNVDIKVDIHNMFIKDIPIKTKKKIEKVIDDTTSCTSIVPSPIIDDFNDMKVGGTIQKDIRAARLQYYGAK